MNSSSIRTESRWEAMLARRKVLLAGFLGSLAGAYGFFAVLALKFIFPKRSRRPVTRIFLGFASDLGIGESRVKVMPSGDQLLISNTGQARAASGSPFVAFSNHCPHLGCKVHWRAADSHFECPCHQGIFDSNGLPLSGPPAQSGQSLVEYRLELKGDAIYALVEEG